MVKKNQKNDTDMYQVDQVNKKHRGKSDKLLKRIEKKRNKKKIKSTRHAKKTLFKYLIKKFHEHKKKIDVNRIPLDFDEIELTVKKIISHKDKDSINRLLTMVNQMEKNPKEVNLASFENKAIIKDVCKLMRTLRARQNPKNQLKFSLYHMFQKRNIKARYTSNIEEIIPECLDSYYLLVKSLFEYYSKEDNNQDNDSNNKELIENENQNKVEKEEELFDKEKYELDAEYEAIENQVGKNAELINKAFNRIINDNGYQKNKEKLLQKQEEEIKESTNLNDLEINQPDYKDEITSKGPSGKDFLKLTLGMLE